MFAEKNHDGQVHMVKNPNSLFIYFYMNSSSSQMSLSDIALVSQWEQIQHFLSPSFFWDLYMPNLRNTWSNFI